MYITDGFFICSAESTQCPDNKSEKQIQNRFFFHAFHMSKIPVGSGAYQWNASLGKIVTSFSDKLFRFLVKVETFRLEDEYEDLTCRFFRIFSKNRQPASFYLLSPKQLALLSLLKEVKRSPDSKMIKLLTFDNLFLSLEVE